MFNQHKGNIFCIYFLSLLDSKSKSILSRCSTRKSKLKCGTPISQFVLLLSSKVTYSVCNICTAYFKISNGFVLVCDYNRPDSLKFLEKQIQQIFHSSCSFYNNIFLLVNKRTTVTVQFYHVACQQSFRNRVTQVLSQVPDHAGMCQHCRNTWRQKKFRQVLAQGLHDQGRSQSETEDFLKNIHFSVTVSVSVSA